MSRGWVLGLWCVVIGALGAGCSTEARSSPGVPDLDNLTNQLRRSIDGAEPGISTMLNAAQSDRVVGDAYYSTASCPRSPIG